MPVQVLIFVPHVKKQKIAVTCYANLGAIDCRNFNLVTHAKWVDWLFGLFLGAAWVGLLK